MPAKVQPGSTARRSASLQLYDPRRGDPALRVDEVRNDRVRLPSRANYFTVIWLRSGRGRFHADLREHEFAAPCLLFGNPYQTLFLVPESSISGARVRFHANFFCIETYHEEVGCNGVLFNDVYGAPVLPVKPERASEFDALIASMCGELQLAGLAHSELLLSYLKVFLIKATRLKMDMPLSSPAKVPPHPEALQRLIELVEIHHRAKHRPSEYASLLGLSEKALNKLAKKHVGKNLTLLIRERVLKHAKWHLLHTRKPVKEIAAEAGFADELYFSRLFKQATGMAPTAFREFETAIRAGRNLSM